MPGSGVRGKKPTLEHVDGARSRSNGKRLVMKTRQGGRDTGIKKQGRGNRGEEKGGGAEEWGKITVKKEGETRGPGLRGLAGTGDPQGPPQVSSSQGAPEGQPLGHSGDRREGSWG